MKATEQYFPVVLIIKLYKVVLTFESVNSYSVIIHMKAFELYFRAMLLFKCFRKKLNLRFLFSTSQTVTLTDLQPETTYEIKVSAYTVKGDGASSIPAFAKTLAKLPYPPYVFKIPSLSSSDVGIRWRTLARNVISFRLRYGKSLRRLCGQDSLKMKEMTFLPGTNEHVFKELGELYMFCRFSICFPHS